MILDNLYRSGVQNTIKQERLTFETLEPFAGHWLRRNRHVHRCRRQVPYGPLCHLVLSTER